jgi:hypothetical protein
VTNIKPNVSSYSGSSTIKQTTSQTTVKQTINNNVSTYNKNGQVTTNGSSTSKVNVVSTGVVQNNKSNGSKTTVAVSTASSTPITYNRNGSITTSSSTAKINTTVNWTSGSTTTKQVVISNGSRTPNYSASSTPIINNRNGSYTPESASSIKLGGSTTPKVQYNSSNNVQSKKEEATILSVGWNFSKGVVEGVGNGVKDVLNLGKNIVFHPIKTTEEFAEGVSYVAKHPIKTKDAVVEAVNKGYEDFKKADANEKANMIGKITGDVLLSAIGSKGIDKAADLAKGTKVVSKFSEAVSNVGDVAKYKVTKIVPKPTPAVAIAGGGSIRVAANEIDDVARKGIMFAEKSEDVASGVGKVGSSGGRSGKQVRLREIANDDKVSSALKGEIKRDINEINAGKRKNIRVPHGYELAHRRGYEARNGYGYEYSDLQVIKNHRTQHKIDGYGKKMR